MYYCNLLETFLLYYLVACTCILSCYDTDLNFACLLFSHWNICFLLVCFLVLLFASVLCIWFLAFLFSHYFLALLVAMLPCFISCKHSWSFPSCFAPFLPSCFFLQFAVWVCAFLVTSLLAVCLLTFVLTWLRAFLQIACLLTHFLSLKYCYKMPAVVLASYLLAS